jgi:exopolysaccharide biosynthesis WecB/TagA/CpsF family protein
MFYDRRGFGYKYAGLDRRAFVERSTVVSRKPARLFGFNLLNATRSEAAAEIIRRTRADQQTTVNFLNAHCVNIAAGDAAYRSILESTDMLLPDGSGMRLAARLGGQAITGNLNGTDLFPELCALAAQQDLGIYLLGGEPGVATRAAAAMAERYPGLRVAGARDGFFTDDNSRAVVDQINASGADLLFVGLGVPRQEKWIAEFREHLRPSTVLGVGGLFDYYSGRIARAPVAMRKLGCEWIWRLMKEPRRLMARYLVGNLLFVGRAWAASRIAGRHHVDAKRLFDMLAAAAGLIVVAPVGLAVAVAIKLDSPGPVFFRQLRVGDHGRPFRMWKFRSMVVDADARLAALVAYSDRDATCFKMRSDPRVTRVGRFVRRWSIDELPQLINVLLGDMSLVGPRPALATEAVSYGDDSWGRLRGKPGITCSWQVGGRAEISFDEQVQLDITYLEDRGFGEDIKLLARTIPAVLSARGAY